MNPEPIFIELSNGLRKLLGSKRIDLRTELSRERIDAEFRGLSLSGRHKVRDVYLVVLATGVAASLVGGAISRIISALAGHKRVQMKERDLRPALNGNGKPILDQGGNPVYELTERPAKPSPGENSTSRLSAGRFLSFEVSTGAAKSLASSSVSTKDAKGTGARSKRRVTRNKNNRKR